MDSWKSRIPPGSRLACIVRVMLVSGGENRCAPFRHVLVMTEMPYPKDQFPAKSLGQCLAESRAESCSLPHLARDGSSLTSGLQGCWNLCISVSPSVFWPSFAATTSTLQRHQVTLLRTSAGGINPQFHSTDTTVHGINVI